MALKVSRFRDVTKHLLGKLTKGLLIPPASLCCATSKAQQVCSLIGTTPGVIKMPKGAVFIRVNLFKDPISKSVPTVLSSAKQSDLSVPRLLSCSKGEMGTIGPGLSDGGYIFYFGVELNFEQQNLRGKIVQ